MRSCSPNLAAAATSSFANVSAVLGVSNLHIYAAMRGETLEAFQRTRNAPGALYSVAGKDAPAPAWDKATVSN